MKFPVFIIILALLVSCGNKNTEEAPETAFVADKYDTVATDSFSAGAISVDIARQIRMSSVEYQDSVKAVQLAEAKALADEKLKKDSEKLKALDPKNPEKPKDKKEDKPKETEKKPEEEKKENQ